MNMLKHLLVINDEPGMLEQMQRWLGGAGYAVKSTLWGEVGVAMARQFQFDLILLDYNLKRENGGAKNARAFISQLIGINPKIPIIVVSATMRNLAKEELGVADVLVVDRFFWKKLLEMVAETLKN